ncbi:MAG: DUF938 domain-containing protein [Byssovorax sp.]
MKRHAPATERNREPILAVLRDVLPAAGVVLEIAAGSGEHAVFFAAALPALAWQPTDPDRESLSSIADHASEAALANLRAPLRCDVTEPGWGRDLAADAVVCINMIHIAPWEACLGLLAGASALLAPGNPLVLYGPYRFEGAFTAPSNADFDASLRARDPRWGVRDLADVTREAEAVGFTRERVVALPANNHSLVFRRV